MPLIYGSGLLFAALMLLCAGRTIFARLDATPGEASFGPTEALGIAFTALLAFGLSFIVQILAQDQGAATLAQIGAALAAVVAATVTIWKLAARLGAAGVKSTLPEMPEGRPTSRGPNGTGRTQGAARAKRAA